MSAKTLRSAVFCFVFVFSLQVCFAQDKTVTGKVTDSKDGSPVAGATVQGKGTQTGTSTRGDGTFSITVPTSVTTLVITSVGFETQEISIDGKTSVDVLFVPSAGNSLNEVIVIGYGNVRKKDYTGAVSTIRAKDFNKGVQTAPDLLIQGKVPGVHVVNNSGAPGGATTVHIRGASSIRAGNQPLYVIDGVPLDGRSARPFTAGPDFGNTPAGNPLNFISSGDIQSMDVLKDASASAIYGSRGSNGVVLITTKKGAAGQPRIDVSASAGFNKMLRKLEVLDGARYRAALTQFGLPATGDFGSNVDAFDAIVRTGFIQNYHVGVSGGNENAKFRMGLGYLDQDGIVRKTNFKKYSAHITTNFKFLESKRLGIDINVLSSQNLEKIAPISNNAGFKGSLIGQALQWNPTRPLRKPDGSLNVDQGGDQINPLGMSEAYFDDAKVTTVLGSISPYYKFTNDLEYRFLYSIYYSSGNRKSYIKSFINLAGVQSDPGAGKKGGWASIGNNELITQQATHTLNYTKDISPGLNLNAVVGYEYMKFNHSGAAISGLNFENTSLPYYNYLQYSTQGERIFGSFADPTVELQSFFARGIFNVRDKYLLTATFRADGSSKFGENNKYGYFPSFAAAWVMTNETFLAGNNFVQSLKLRASWGQTGNQEFPAGASQELWSAGQQSFSQTQLPNPDLRWETTSTINVGIDFSILKNRISGSLDYFNKKSKDLLFAKEAADPVPPINAIKWENLDARVVNSGLEALVNVAVVRKSNLTWDFGVNATFLNNEVQDFIGSVETGEINGQGLSGVRSQLVVSGQPLNVFFLKRFLGINKTTGLSDYEGGEAKFFVGDPNPNMLIGINSYLTYKKWGLDISMNGAFGHYIYNNTANAVLPLSNLGKRNIAVSVLEGATDEILANPISASSRYLEKGNFMKLANATLSYRIGDLGKTFKNGNIYITGQNLFILTDFTGFDPEVNTDKSFNGIPSYGIEYTPYPTARTITLGINFSL